MRTHARTHTNTHTHMHRRALMRKHVAAVRCCLAALHLMMMRGAMQLPSWTHWLWAWSWTWGTLGYVY